MDISLLDSSTPDVLTAMEAAEVLHIGRSTIYKLLATGDIQSFKIGTKILIPKTFLQDFIAKSVGIRYDSNIQMAENLSCCKKGEHI